MLRRLGVGAGTGPAHGRFSAEPPPLVDPAAGPDPYRLSRFVEPGQPAWDAVCAAMADVDTRRIGSLGDQRHLIRTHLFALPSPSFHLLPSARFTLASLDADGYGAVEPAFRAFLAHPPQPNGVHLRANILRWFAAVERRLRHERDASSVAVMGSPSYAKRLNSSTAAFASATAGGRDPTVHTAAMSLYTLANSVNRFPTNSFAPEADAMR